MREHEHDDSDAGPPPAPGVAAAMAEVRRLRTEHDASPSAERVRLGRLGGGRRLRDDEHDPAEATDDDPT